MTWAQMHTVHIKIYTESIKGQHLDTEEKIWHRIMKLIPAKEKFKMDDFLLIAKSCSCLDENLLDACATGPIWAPVSAWQ